MSASSTLSATFLAIKIHSQRVELRGVVGSGGHNMALRLNASLDALLRHGVRSASRKIWLVWCWCDARASRTGCRCTLVRVGARAEQHVHNFGMMVNDSPHQCRSMILFITCIQIHVVSVLSPVLVKKPTMADYAPGVRLRMPT